MRFASHSRLASLSLLTALALGCAANGSTEPRPDAGGGADAGMRADGAVSFVDGGSDGAVPGDDGGDVAERDGGADDGGNADDGGGGDVDGGALDAGGVDGGMTTTPIAIDGVLGAAEWAGAASATNTTATGWAGNTLTRLLATVRDGALYVAVEGSLMAGAENAILVYVDNERGSGVGVEDPITLTDGEGALDNAVSAGITTPADFEADYAWGTRDMGRAASGFDARMGWRDIAMNPADFGWIEASEAPTACSASACETRIPLSRLGGSATGTIALFGRLGNTDGTMLSNQTVPMDAPAMPGMVSMVLAVPR